MVDRCAGSYRVDRVDLGCELFPADVMAFQCEQDDRLRDVRGCGP